VGCWGADDVYLVAYPAVSNPFRQRGSDLVEDKWIRLRNGGEHARWRTYMTNLNHFRGSGPGHRSLENGWAGDSGCALELDQIAATP
jgi:hypothetical protein